MKIPIINILFLCTIGMINAQNTNQQISSCEMAVQLALNYYNTRVDSQQQKEIVRNVKSAWYQLLFELNIEKILINYKLFYYDLERVVNLRFQSGDIDLQQKNMYLSLLADLESNLIISNNNVEIIINRIRQLLLSDLIIIPADTTLNLYEIDKPEPVKINSSLFADQNFEDNSTHIDNKRFYDSLNINILKLQLENNFVRLQYAQHYALINAQEIIKFATIKLKAEEIDYLTFVNDVKNTLVTQSEYFIALNDYNQTAILLEYEAY